MQTLNRPKDGGLSTPIYQTTRMTADGRLWTTGTRAMTSAEAQMIHDRCLPTYDTRRQVINNVNTGSNDGYAYLVKGTALPDPPEVILEGKSLPPNKGFIKRQKKGEIIMSDAYHYKIRAQVRLGWKDDVTKALPSGKVPLKTYLSGSPHTDPSVPSIKYELIHLNGDQYLSIGNKTISFLRESVQRYQVYPEAYDPRALEALAQFPIEIQSDLVTSAVSDANKHHMDILTFAAEFPETVKNTISGFRSVAAAMVALRKKELSISKSFESRKKRLRAMFERDSLALNGLKAAAKQRKQKRQIEKRQQHLQRTFKRDLESALADFVSAIASIWMTFRYEISPNLYAIQDALDVLANQYSDYQTSREKDDFDLKIEIYPEKFFELKSTHRVVLKQRYALDRSDSARLSSTMSMNVFTTLWELGKRTFVVDWFINVGDFLTASLGYDSSIQRVCSYSRKHEGQQFIEYDAETGSGIYLTVNSWKREIINPTNYLGLCFRPEFSLARLFDSVAMLWSPIKRSLITSKRGK